MIVVDTNAVVALLLNTDATEDARRWQQEHPRWAAPRLLLAEVHNVLIGEVRRGNLLLTDAVAMADAVDEHLTWLPDPPPASILAAAQAGNLSAYDATFVAAAEAGEARLLTADRAILRAYPSLAVRLDAEAARRLSGEATGTPRPLTEPRPPSTDSDTDTTTGND